MFYTNYNKNTYQIESTLQLLIVKKILDQDMVYALILILDSQMTFPARQLWPGNTQFFTISFRYDIVSTRSLYSTDAQF